MPAPQAAQMQQLARAHFMQFALVVPTNWQEPSGDPAGKQYQQAFKDSEKATAPGSPPLFIAATANKYCTDTQKMLIAKYGAFIDGICSALCSAWSQWQTMAAMAGVVVNAIVGSAGQIAGPPLMPLIMESAPKASPNELKYSTAIAQTINTGWLAYTASIKIPGLPMWPAFAMFPGPMAPPTPCTPVPFTLLTQVAAPITMNVTKPQMIAALGDPNAPFHKELFESIAYAFEQCYNVWNAATQLTNVMGTGAVATFAPPIVPAGPVLGVGMMAPGGIV